MRGNVFFIHNIRWLPARAILDIFQNAASVSYAAAASFDTLQDNTIQACRVSRDRRHAGYNQRRYCSGLSARLLLRTDTSTKSVNEHDNVNTGRDEHLTPITHQTPPVLSSPTVYSTARRLIKVYLLVMDLSFDSSHTQSMETVITTTRNTFCRYHSRFIPNFDKLEGDRYRPNLLL